MKQRWKPGEELITALEECGIDKEILNDLLSQVTATADTSNVILLTKEFVVAAVEEQISWESAFDSLDEDLKEYAQPKIKMSKSWRPKEKTIQLLLNALEYNRVKIGFIREEFKKENQGKYFSAWDCKFIDYAVAYFEQTLDANDQSATSLQEDIEFSEITELQRHKNLFIIRQKISLILKDKYVSNYFNYPLNESWQPAKWIVEKLQRSNISKSFIYDESILKPFINHYKNRGSMFTNLNAEYYRWVISRFRIKLKLLLEEKARLENRIKNE